MNIEASVLLILLMSTGALCGDRVIKLNQEVDAELQDDLTNKDEPNFVWKTYLGDESSSSALVIDINSEHSFYGLQLFNGEKFADWGLKSCDGNNGCTISGEKKTDFSYWPSLYPDLKNIPFVDAEVVLRLSSFISYHKDSLTMPIKLLGSSKEKSPFPEGAYGAIGFAPGGDFITYLRKAYKWNNDQVTIKFNPLKLDNTKNGFANKGGIFIRNDFNFQTVFPAPTVEVEISPPQVHAKNEKVIMQTKEVHFTSNRKEIWRMPSVTMTIAEKYDSVNSISLIDEKDLCFTPRVNNLMTFYDDGIYQKFKKAVFNQICGKDDGCPSGSKWLHVAPIRVILNKLYGSSDKVKYPSLYLLPQDYLYDDGKNIVLAVDSLKSLS